MVQINKTAKVTLTAAQRLLAQSKSIDVPDSGKGLQQAVGALVRQNLEMAARVGYSKGQPSAKKDTKPLKKAKTNSAPQITFGGEPKKGPDKPKKKTDGVVVKS